MHRTQAQALFAILRERFPQIRFFVPDVLATLRFESPEADNQLLAAPEILRRMGFEHRRKVPPEAPSGFVPVGGRRR